ncbi:MAG: apolipoprotein N-acyltransferase [Saprospiraceae bacterium]|nr:apolipoprotein N-acyltransferase [Saprospiraceae bacterium]MBK9729299.1 apolipoprotein N-acyltransferase [Saprospiraceae bacterium]
MKKQSIITLGIGLILIGIAGFFGYKMYNLKFWGDYPLYIFLAGWFGFLCLLRARKAAEEEHKYMLFLSVASGLILGKAFVYTSPLLFIGFLPLLVLQHQLEAGASKSKNLYHWVYAFNAFAIWNITATYWVANAALFPALVAFFLNSLFMTIPWMGMLAVGRRFPKLKYLSFIAFWICFEWVHHAWDISWPWLTLGNGLAFFPKWIQWYDTTGVYGGSLWILIINCLLASLYFKQLPRKYGFSVLGLILLLPIGISYSKYNNYKLKGKSVEVGIVQPNYEPHYQKFEVDQNLQMIHFEKYSRAAFTPNTKYLIWPETSFEYIDIDQFNSDWRIKRMKDLVSTYSNLCLVTGIGSIKSFKAGEELSNAVRENKRGGFPKYFEIQNSAIQVCSAGGEIPVYVKSKLVPGVETFPYRHLLPFLKPVVDKLGGSVQGLGRQRERSVFESGSTKIAPVICYESIYGNYIGDYIRNGAEAIFIMTNDGWWDDTPGYHQHLAYGILRAIEFRKPIARSANTGISCFVDAKGDVSLPTSYGKEASLISLMLFNKEKTIYLQTGDLIAMLCIAMSACILLFSLFKFLTIRFSKNQ